MAADKRHRKRLCRAGTKAGMCIGRLMTALKPAVRARYPTTAQAMGTGVDSGVLPGSHLKLLV